MKYLILTLLSFSTLAAADMQNIAKMCPDGSDLVRNKSGQNPSEHQSLWKCVDSKTGMYLNGYQFSIVHWKSGNYLKRSIIPSGMHEFDYNPDGQVSRIRKKEEGKYLYDCEVEYENGFAKPTHHKECNEVLQRMNTMINIASPKPEVNDFSSVFCNKSTQQKECVTEDGRVYIRSTKENIGKRIEDKLQYDAFGNLIEGEQQYKWPANRDR